MQRKVMILGAGVNQLSLIHKAKEMGLLTIVASRAGDYPGFDIADIALPIDVKDRDALLQKAKDFGINAIVTNQTDMPVSSVAYIAEKLDLPGIGMECAESFRNKYLMRKVSADCGAVSIPHVAVDCLEDALEAVSQNMVYPLVIKPLDSQGSRGVVKLSCREELVGSFEKAKKFSSTGEVIIEQYFEGRELKIDGLMYNERYYSFPLGDVEMFEHKDLFIPKTSLYPSSIEHSLQAKVRHINETIVNKLGLPFGLTHAEYRVCEDTGDVVLIEIAARGGGTFISSDLMPLCTGIDVERVLLKQVLGDDCEELDWSCDKASGYYFAGSMEGTLVDISGLDKASQLPGVHRIINNVSVGSYLSKMQDKTARPIGFLLCGESRAQVDETIERLKRLVSFVVKKDDGSLLEVGL